MPKRSAESLSVAPIRAPERPPLIAPTDLSPGARAVWKATVASVPAEHFRLGDTPLLKTFCEVSAMADQAAAELVSSGAVVNGKISPWITIQERSVRAQSTLALRLRLCPSARIDPRVAGRNRGPEVFKPDFSTLERK